MAHQPKSKELTYNHTSIQAQNRITQETTPNVHTQKACKTIRYCPKTSNHQKGFEIPQQGITSKMRKNSNLFTLKLIATKLNYLINKDQA
jgi:hypothetical protein